MTRHPGSVAGANGRARVDTKILTERFRGELFHPGDPGYIPGTRLWNGMISRRPALVARCAGTGDVVTAVGFARDHDMPLAIRGGGHGVAGHALCDDGVVVDLSAMRRADADASRRIARAQGGCTLGDLDQATQAHGLATPLGVVTATGIAGLTLSGGMGWLRRKHGLSCDNLVAAEVVTASGATVRASESEHEDLFWALRGGGGNFGVVTSFEYRLHPVGPDVFLCYVLYPATEAHEVLRATERFVASEPDLFAPVGVLGRVPPVAEVAPKWHGQPFVAVLGVYPGDPDEGERALRPLRRLAAPIADFSARMPYVQAQGVLDEEYPDGWQYYWKSVNIPELSDEVITRVVEGAAAAPCPHSTIDVWFQGGAMARVSESETAVANRGTPYLIGIEGNCEHPSAAEASLAWVRGVVTELRRFSQGGIYLNFPGFLEEGESLVREGLSNYDRLVEVKTSYDPGNLFRLNANIPPRR